MDGDAFPPPPAVFSTTERPYDPKDLFDSSGSDPNDDLMSTEEYQEARTGYLRDARRTNVDRFLFAKMSGIKEILTSGTEQEVIALMKRRHESKKRAMQASTEDQQICACPTCAKVAVPGSSFCIAHILNDSEQKLFAECPTCHRPHPVFGDCFLCRPQPARL